METNYRLRIALGLVAAGGLVFVFLFQRHDLATLMGVEGNIWKFMVNRSIRFLINDTLAILLIYALFFERKYVIFAIYVQLFGLVFVLLPYFFIKYQFPAYNGPLISFLHRLVLNPTLILLLIPAFYYQHHRSR